MRRRAFIATLAAAPLFIRRAFGDASVGAAPSTKSTRPTLVFVVPRDEQQRWDRGAAFGDFLNHAGDRALAPLALVDVVCAPAADYGISGDPLMLYVAGGKVRTFAAPRGPALVARIGAVVSEVAPLGDGDIASLAAAARQRYVKKAPRGARWGRTSMCGAVYEEGPADAVDCGMGSISEPSRRFLDFYAKRP